MTARATSPFLTLALGMASLMETTMTSPTEAYLRFVPPRTRMHMIFLAPELSATSSVVAFWTRAAAPPPAFRWRFEQLFAPPALLARERPRLDDHLLVAGLVLVLLV